MGAAWSKLSITMGMNHLRSVSTHQSENSCVASVDLALPRGAEMLASTPRGWSM